MTYIYLFQRTTMQVIVILNSIIYVIHTLISLITFDVL